MCARLLGDIPRDTNRRTYLISSPAMTSTRRYHPYLINILCNSIIIIIFKLSIKESPLNLTPVP